MSYMFFFNMISFFHLWTYKINFDYVHITFFLFLLKLPHSHSNFHIFWQRLWIQIVKTPTQLQRNLNPTIVGGLTWKWLCTPHHPTPPHPTQTQYPKYLSCYFPDFDQTLKTCIWDYLEHIPNVTVTFVQATFVRATFVHMRNISSATDPILTKL